MRFFCLSVEDDKSCTFPTEQSFYFWHVINAKLNDPVNIYLKYVTCDT